MKRYFLLLFTILALTACNKEENITPVQTTQIEQPQQQKKLRKARIHIQPPYIHTTHDIVEFLPYTVTEQNKLFHQINRLRFNNSSHETKKYWTNGKVNAKHWGIYTQCLKTNSYAQTTEGIYSQYKLDFENARHWYLKAAEKGNAYAMNRLGEMYLLGLGVPIDKEQATYWFERSSERGYYFADSALGMMALGIDNFQPFFNDDHLTGLWFNKRKIQKMKKGKKADINSASYWFSRAVRAGDEDSLYIMKHFNIPLSQFHMEREITEIKISRQQPSCFDGSYLAKKQELTITPLHKNIKNILERSIITNKNNVPTGQGSLARFTVSLKGEYEYSED